MSCKLIKYILFFIIVFTCSSPRAQEGTSNYLGFDDPERSLWLGTYMNFRISDKFYWAGEFHYRRTEYNAIPFVGRMGQIYNRHGIKYVASKKFSSTVGGVLRLNFSPQPGNSDFKDLVLEPRIWHEYVFAIPFERFMLYHRLRFEHRWSKSNKKGASFVYRNRYRYKFYMKFPLNNKKLVPGTYYFSPDIELIMQSGSSVPFQPMEDIRIYPHIGYIYSPRIGGSIGLAYTTGQKMDIGDFYYNQRWLLRINAYISLDFRKFEQKVPEINLND